MTGTFLVTDQGSTIGLSIYPEHYEHPIHLVIEGNTVYVTRTTKSGAVVTSGVDSSGHTAVDELRAGLFRLV